VLQILDACGIISLSELGNRVPREVRPSSASLKALILRIPGITVSASGFVSTDSPFMSSEGIFRSTVHSTLTLYGGSATSMELGPAVPRAMRPDPSASLASLMWTHCSDFTRVVNVYGFMPRIMLK